MGTEELWIEHGLYSRCAINSLTDLISLDHCLEGGCSEVGVSVLSQVTSDRTGGKGLKLEEAAQRSA